MLKLATPPKAKLGDYTRRSIYKEMRPASMLFGTQQTQRTFVKMFKYLFALFALLAVAFAAPAANPSPVANPAPPTLVYSGLAYTGAVPHATTYTTYPHVNIPSVAVPSAYVYGAPVVYG